MDAGTRQICSGVTSYPYTDGDDTNSVLSDTSHVPSGDRRNARLSFRSAPPALVTEGSKQDKADTYDIRLSRLHTGDCETVSGQAKYARDAAISTSSSSRVQSPPVLSLKRSVSDRFDFEDHESATQSPKTPEDDDLVQQVKAAVPADDESLSINTPRMWTLAMISAVVGSSMNLLYSLRYPSVTLTPIVALLVAYPCGMLWDRALKRPDDPNYAFVNGEATLTFESDFCNGSDRSLTGHRAVRTRLRIWLAQGRWNRKEHACIFVSSNVSFAFAFATDIITEQVKFYKQDASVVYQILLILSTQLLGYSLAGMFSDFLVRPKEMVWPTNLIATSMLSTLHVEEDKPSGRWRISRWRFFVVVFGASFAWYFLPGLLMPALSYFNALTWVAPNSTVIANLFGISSGLGMLPITFDWSQIAYTGSPLVVPFWAAMNVLAGLMVVMWLIAPILYYTNAFFSSYLPILDASVYDNTAQIYDISKILTPTYLFHERSYHNYSAVFLPMTYALSYSVQFASMTALLTHTICYHGKAIWRQLQTSLAESRMQWGHGRSRRSQELGRTNSDQPLLDHDSHNSSRRKQKYREVPFTWYLATGLTTVFIGMFVVEYYPIHLPWWSILIALATCLFLLLPIGIVMAMTNLQISIYLISQILAGLMFPGRGVANMIFVTYTYITSTQALKFSSDLKLGLYMSIPPRILFKVQLIATIVSSLTQIAVLNWAFKAIPGICTPEAVNGFTCPIARVHFNGSVLWGVIGPQRFFGTDALYRPLIWAFPLGAVLPVLVWAIGRREGASNIWRKINFPVLFGSLSWIPPATGLNFSVWALVCFVFNYGIRRRHGDWWKKYNTILSAGLDAGTAVSVLVVFFGIVYWGFSEGFSWWGTEVYKQGCDWGKCAFKGLREGETFGPGTWR